MPRRILSRIASPVPNGVPNRIPNRAAPRPATRRRAGFALAVAVLAIVVIGALIGGVFFASTEQYRLGRNQQLQARAMAAAEYGQNRVITTDWNANTFNRMAQGTVDSSRSYTLANGTAVGVRVSALGSGTFLVASEARAGSILGAQARRRTGILVTLLSPQLNLLGALTTRGDTKIGGSSFIDGNDTTTYSGWGCPPPPAGGNPKLPGIAINDTTKISTSGCNNYSCVSGQPKIAQIPAAGDTSTYFTYGNGLKWADLVAMASKTASGTVNGVGPVTSAGSCSTSSLSNWGDPNRAATPGPCEGYYPIIYAPGDLNITGGVGQGILLVNGNLKVTGGFRFYGPVIVRKDLDTSGQGGHFNGGVMAANVNLDQNAVLGNAVITYSSCVISAVLAGVAVPRPLAMRPWLQLF